MKFKLKSFALLICLVTAPSFAETIDLDAWIQEAAQPGLKTRLVDTKPKGMVKTAFTKLIRNAKPTDIYLTPVGDIQVNNLTTYPLLSTEIAESYVYENCTSSPYNIDTKIDVALSVPTTILLDNSIKTTGKSVVKFNFSKEIDAGDIASIEGTFDVTNNTAQILTNIKKVPTKITGTVPPNTIMTLEMLINERPISLDFEENILVDAKILGYNFKDLVAQNQLKIAGIIKGITQAAITQSASLTPCAQNKTFSGTHANKGLYAALGTGARLNSASTSSIKSAVDLVKLEGKGLDYRSTAAKTIEIEQEVDGTLEIIPADIIGKIKAEVVNTGNQICTANIVANNKVVSRFNLMPSEKTGWKTITSFVGAKPISIKTESDCGTNLKFKIKYPI